MVIRPYPSEQHVPEAYRLIARCAHCGLPSCDGAAVPAGKCTIATRQDTFGHFTVCEAVNRITVAIASRRVRSSPPGKRAIAQSRRITDAIGTLPHSPQRGRVRFPRVQVDRERPASESQHLQQQIPRWLMRNDAERFQARHTASPGPMLMAGSMAKESPSGSVSELQLPRQRP